MIDRPMDVRMDGWMIFDDDSKNNKQEHQEEAGDGSGTAPTMMNRSVHKRDPSTTPFPFPDPSHTTTPIDNVVAVVMSH